MKVKAEIYFDIEDEVFEEQKKLEPIAEYIFNLEEYPEIKSVYSVSFTQKTNDLRV